MSKFIDMLNRSSQTTPQPIGFRTSKPVQAKHRMQLVAAITNSTTDMLTDYVTGADAGLLRISGAIPGSSALKKTIPTSPDIPWGIWLEKAAQDEMKKAMKSACDFVVFPAGAALSVPPDDSVGAILQVDTSFAEGPLRTLNELPIDAVLVKLQSEKKGLITWHQLMLIQRFGDIITKPLLVLISPDTGSDELQLFYKSGIDGVVVEIELEQAPGEINQLRQLIDDLKPSPTHKRQKMDAILPYSDRDTETIAEVEEEEEE